MNARCLTPVILHSMNSITELGLGKKEFSREIIYPGRSGEKSCFTQFIGNRDEDY